MNIALIAHDSKKSSLIDFVCERRNFFSRLDVNLMATKNTAELLNQCGIHINQVCHSGPLGGDIEIAAKVCAGDVDLVVFFRDSLSSHPHQADIDALIRVCDLYEVPVVTNKKAAQSFNFNFIDTKISNVGLTGIV